MIETVRLGLSNVHLLMGERVVVVDSGVPGSADVILRRLVRLGRGPRDVSLVVLTHGHADHAGDGAALARAAGAPVALHGADWGMVQAGKNHRLAPQGLTARMLLPIVDKPFPAFTPDIDLAGGLDLGAFGVDRMVEPVGGHTAGSVVVWTDDRRRVIAGDLLRGGHVGGRVLPGKALHHYYCDCPASNDAALAGVLAHSPEWLHLGHGGPVSLAAARGLRLREARPAA